MKKILLTSFLALGIGANAQVTGTKTIGTDYATLAIAFADLNANGVGSGGVIINVPAGYTESSPAGGYQLGSTILNASLSASQTLVIQKSGSGANPLFIGTAGTSGSATVTGIDAIFKFSGVDYVTIDGLDLKENENNNDPATLNERGFAFYNLTATDGCNYNTVKNSTITFLKTVNNTATGILFAHTTSAGVTIVPTSLDGTHSNNKIYSNTIVKSLGSAISFTGYAATAPYTLFDQNNDIGGSSSTTANTLTDFGGLAGGSFFITSYALYTVYQNNANISNNIVNYSEDGLGTVGVYTFGTNSTFIVNNNTFNLGGQTYGTTPSVHAGIYSNAAGTNLTANNNKINIKATSFNGVATVYGINFTSTGNLSATGNTITAAGPSTVYGLYSAAAGNVDITNNTIRNIISSGASYNATALYLASTGATTNISGNKISNVSSNGATSSAYGLYVGGSNVSNTNIFNNLIGDIKTPAASSTAVSLAGIYLASSGATSNLNLYYNSIYLNGTSTGANFNSTGIYHTYNTTATTAALNLRNNIIVNLSTPNGTGVASALRRSSATNLNNYAATSNNNDFAVASAGSVYYNGTTKYNFSDFQTHVTTRESSSLNITPIFKSTSGTDANFLKLNENASSTQALDNKGVNIAGYTTDIAGTTRNAATPDLGAYEFSYVMPTVAPGCTTVTPANGATGVIPNQATISWLTAEGATSYKLYLGTTSGGAEIVNGISFTDTSYSFTATSFSTYYVKVVPYNDAGEATGCSETKFTTTYCGVSVSTANAQGFGNISGVTFADINHSSVGNDNSYKDYTSIVANVVQEKNYAITVDQTSYNAGNGNVMNVWIDYNQDGVFSDSEKTTLTPNTGVSGFTGTINIPTDAQLGNTRMRVRLNLLSVSPPACGVTQYGQTEDYTVNIKDKTLAVSDINKANLSVYPNPFVNVLNISDIRGVKSISVNDMTGRQVKSLAPSAEINLSSLNAGLYIVNLQMEDGSVKTFKAIKK